MHPAAVKVLKRFACVCVLTLLACGGPSEPTSGDLVIEIVGLPNGAVPSITVVGPDGTSRAITAASTLSRLQPGSYVVNAEPVLASGGRFVPQRASQRVNVGTR